MPKKTLNLLIVGLFVLSVFSSHSLYLSAFSIDVNWVSIWGNGRRTSSINVDYPDKAKLTEIWNRNIGPNTCIYPVTWDRKVFICENGAVIALDCGTGSVIWSYECNVDNVFMPVISDKIIYFPAYDGENWHIYGLDVRNGVPKAKIKITHEPRLHAVSDGFLYYSIIRQDVKGRYSMYFKYNIAKKTFGWQIRLSGELNFDCHSKDHIIIRNTFYDETNPFPEGSLVCIDKSDGDTIWSREIDKDSQIDGHIICDDDTVYYGSNTGVLRATNIEDGSLIWEKQFIESGYVGAKAFVDGILMITVKGVGVLCLDAATGETVWQIDNPETDDSVMAATNHNIYLFYHDSYQQENTNPSVNSRFLVCDIETGDFVVEDRFSKTPKTIAIDENNLYLTTKEGILYCFERKLAILSIIILPTYNNVYFGDTKQMSAYAIDFLNREIEGLPFEWSVDPPEIGTIDKYGLFTPGTSPGRGLVYAKHMDMLGSALVIVCGKPSLSPDSFDFGAVSKGETKTVEIIAGNSSSCMFELKEQSSPDWVVVHDSIYDTQTPVVKVNLELQSKELEPGEYFGEVVFEWDAGTLTLPVSVEVLKPVDISSLFEVSPKLIEEQGIKSWEKTPQKYFITIRKKTSTNESLTVSLSNKSQSIEAHKYVSDETGEITIVVTVDASMIEPGKSIEDYIKITQTGAVGDFSIPIRIAKNRYTNVTLQIGKTVAKVDGQTITQDAAPQIVNGRTLVPIRIIAESLGAKVSWNAEDKRIDILQSNHHGKVTSISLWVGKNEAVINGEKTQIDVAPTIIDSRTFVPVRFISESFGAEVKWFQETKEIEIIYDPLE